MAARTDEGAGWSGSSGGRLSRESQGRGCRAWPGGAARAGRGGALFLGLAALLLAAARNDPEPRPQEPERSIVSLNALDYRLNLFDFRRWRRGGSRQVDSNYREYIGDAVFTGTSLRLLENEDYSGSFLLLGESEGPDSEFSLYHGLRIYKRTFQVREAPFVDRWVPFPSIDWPRFFGRIREPTLEAELEVNHVYVLRLYHRTRLTEDRVFVLRVLDLVPGVSVAFQGRELELSNEP